MHRRNRLGSSSLIRRVHADGVRVRSGAVMVTALMREDGHPQVAVVASRRVGGAVVRNRARRRLRAAAQPLLPSLRPGSTAILAATRQTATMEFQNLEVEVGRAVARAGLRGPADG